MSIRQRGLRILSLGVVLVLAMAVLAACGDEKPPQTIVNTNVGERTAEETTEQPESTTEETTEETTEAEPEEPEVEEEPEPAEPSADGKELFISSGCGACHTLADAGGTGQVGPQLDGAGIDAETAATTIRNGSGAMPPFEGRLSDDEIQAVAQYVADQG